MEQPCCSQSLTECTSTDNGAPKTSTNNDTAKIPTNDDTPKTSTDNGIPTTSLSSNERLRVGYIIRSSRENSIHHMMTSVPRFHDRSKIEVFYYFLESFKMDKTDLPWIKVISDEQHYRNISSDVKLARRLIKDDKIQILVQLNSSNFHNANDVLSDSRLAPIQISLAFESPGNFTNNQWKTTDYFISDTVTLPIHKVYPEKIIYLNRSVFIGNHKQIYSNINKPITLIMEEGTFKCSYINQKDHTLKCYNKKMFNLPENTIVYCNFGKLYKISNLCTILDAWARILSNVPNSVLWLIENRSEIFEDDLKSIQNYLHLKSNIVPSRIIMSDFIDRDQHVLERIPLADIYLDLSYCFNSNASCLDAIWAGVPVVTLPSECLTSRVAASVLNQINCKETIAKNYEDYINIATELGLDEKKLKDIQVKIWYSRIKYKLFDRKLYAEELETIYKRLWDKYKGENNNSSSIEIGVRLLRQYLRIDD